MEFSRSLLILFVILMSFICSSQAYDIYVGGRNGWLLNPSENYNHWAERTRFSVNDTLIFKYKKGSDSVLFVNKEDYLNCDTSKPIRKMDDGDSVFKFNQSGPFYFISGNPGSCEKGQKLIIVVLAVRAKPITPPQAPPPKIPSLTPSPPSDSPSDVNAPSPAPSSSPSFTSSLALVSGVSLLMTMALGSFVWSF